MAKQQDTTDPFLALTEEGKRNLDRIQTQLDQSRNFLSEAKKAGIDNPVLQQQIENSQRMLDLLKKTSV